MSISAQHTAILSITYAETFHLAGAQIPGIEGLANHTTIFPIDLKALVPVHTHRHRQVKMPNAAIGKFYGHKPAIGPKLFDEPGLHTHNLSTQKARCIDEMTGMGQ